MSAVALGNEKDLAGQRSGGGSGAGQGLEAADWHHAGHCRPWGLEVRLVVV